MELSSREAAEMIVALTLLSMTLTAGNAFSGKPLDNGHRLAPLKQMREELSALLERRKGRFQPSPEMQDVEGLRIRRCVQCAKVLRDGEGKIIQCVNFCEVCAVGVDVESRLSTEEKGGPAFQGDLVCSKCGSRSHHGCNHGGLQFCDNCCPMTDYGRSCA